ncbi:MAG TPA: hypothetical protein VF653_10380 [Methylomirabilota bacterium]
MASNLNFVYTRIFGYMLNFNEELDLTQKVAGASGYRPSVALLMSATTVGDDNDTNNPGAATSGEDVEFLDDFADLDEFDGTGYARQVPTTVAVNEDLGSDSYTHDMDNVSFLGISGGSSAIEVVFVYMERGADDSTPEDDWPLYHFGLNPGFTANGGDVLVNWNASGVMTISNA